MKGEILLHGSCRPTGTFPESEKDGRPVFIARHYTIISKGGLQITRDWFYYSPKLKAPYCQTCWLFADRSNARLQWSWINGITGSSGIYVKKIRIHETSDIHISATAVFHRWKCGERLDHSLLYI